MRDSVSEELFSLFTSSDRAEAIAGDLTEERQKLGWIWFWLHVVRITLALWREAVIEAPLQVLALATMACALFIGPGFGGAAAVRLFPQWISPPASWIALSFFWWGGALWIGASLVAMAPQRGVAACATLAVAGEALLIAFGGGMLSHDLHNADFIYITALLVPAPLVVGAAIARWRTLACRVPSIEQH
jgi:hypothetical protein